MKSLAMALWAAAALGQAAAEKPALVNAGKPLAVPFQCGEEDMQWAGMSCTAEEPCPVYLELAAVEAAGNSLFVTGNLHSSATTLYSVLLASSDAGKTWTEPHDRIRGAGLDQIQFFDFESGWATGQILHPLPQDPFLLITQDGGKSWRRAPVFSENRFGSIVQFWFQSKKEGHVVVDRGQSTDSSRYERYETPNAGDTWMIREASDQPIKLRRAPAAEAAYRIRADGPSQSFRIEKRQGAGWTGVAAFLVRAAECKPPERVLAEPPPEQPAETPAAPPPAAPRKPPTLKRER
jgi:hypothetical protein